MNTQAKAIVLYSAYTRDSYSDQAMKLFIEELTNQCLELHFESVVIPEIIKEIPNHHTLNNQSDQIKSIGEKLKNANYIFCATPIYNFTYSPYLHMLFHLLRHSLIEFDATGALISRNMKNKKFYFLFTGRSSISKWYLLTRHVLSFQLAFLFKFWSARLVGINFIGDCHPGQLQERYSIITKRAHSFATSFARKIKYSEATSINNLNCPRRAKLARNQI